MIKTNTPLEIINKISQNTLLEALEIVITEITEDSVTATMPVDKRTHQPMGLLHGGASAALIETIGSLGSSLIIDPKSESVVGLEINVNHIRGVRNGTVTGIGKIIHCGKKTHVWQVDVRDENHKLVCTGRLTVIVISKKD